MHKKIWLHLLAAARSKDGYIFFLSWEILLFPRPYRATLKLGMFVLFEPPGLMNPTQEWLSLVRILINFGTWEPYLKAPSGMETMETYPLDLISFRS